MNTKKESWNDYYKKISRKPPSLLLKVALNEVKQIGIAYDLGAGAGVDSKFLAKQGWNVFAVDKEPSSINFIRKIKTVRGDIKPVLSNFEELTLQKAHLIFASFSLPFCSPCKFPFLWNKIQSSLVGGGILAGTLLGNNDSWVKDSNGGMTFQTNKQILDLFEDYEILYFDEQEEDRPTALGKQKHWHVYSFVVRKH